MTDKDRFEEVNLSDYSISNHGVSRSGFDLDILSGYDHYGKVEVTLDAVEVFRDLQVFLGRHGIE